MRVFFPPESERKAVNLIVPRTFESLTENTKFHDDHLRNPQQRQQQPQQPRWPSLQSATTTTTTLTIMTIFAIRLSTHDSFPANNWVISSKTRTTNFNNANDYGNNYGNNSHPISLWIKSTLISFFALYHKRWLLPIGKRHVWMMKKQKSVSILKWH